MSTHRSRDPNARSDAVALDRERGERGPLHGIPDLVKDNYEVSGLATSAGTVAATGSRLVLPTDPQSR